MKNSIILKEKQVLKIKKEKVMKQRRMNGRSAAAIIACLAVGLTFTACKKSSEKQITGFSFTTPVAVGVIDESAKSIKIDVPLGTDVSALTPTIKASEKAVVSPSSGVVQNFTSPVKYTVTAEDGSTVFYTVTVTVGGGKSVLINGVHWATCNVDKPGTFAKNPEDAGLLYQYGSKIGWSNSGDRVNSDGGTTWVDNSSDTTKWQKANDPSPVGYRVPTKEEFESLIDEEYVSRILTSQNGITGRLFTDKVSGNSVFFPIGHTRDRGGNLSYPGSATSYHSSTEDYNSAYALELGPYGNGAVIRNLYKGGAYSVRSVVE